MENLEEEILRFLDGDMPEAEELKLSAAIKAHPEGQEKLKFLMHFHGMLPTVLPYAETAVKKKPKIKSPKAVKAVKKAKSAKPKIITFFIIAAACLFIALNLQTKDDTPAEIASVLEIKGNAWLKNSDSITELKKGMVLKPGEIVDVKSGSVKLNLLNGRATAVFHNKTTAAINWDKGIKVQLKKGMISADVKKNKDAPIYFTTEDSEALVLGTKLRVVKKTNNSELEVISGSVKYKSRNNQDGVIVKQKQYAIASNKDTVLAVMDFPSGATGYISYERWNNIEEPFDVGRFTGSKKFRQKADFQTTLNYFESPSEAGDYFGSRVSGFLHVPETGEYTFWISADLKANLFLSTNDLKSNLRRIAFVDKWVNSRNWDTNKSQKSKPVKLQKEKVYYISVIHTEDEHNDSMSVAWKGPGFEREIIPGRFLSPSK